MSDSNPKDLGDRLISAEATDSPASPPPSATPGRDPAFELLLEHERHFERRTRRTAIACWALAFVSLVALATSMFLVRNGGGSIVEVARAAVLVFGVTGIVSLLAAAVSSLTWLFRSRTPTLRAIDRRLAALESLLTARGR